METSLHCLSTAYRARTRSTASRAISGAAFSGIDHFSLHVCPPSGTRDLVARDDAVVTALSVCKKNLPVILQKILRSVASSIQREVEDAIRISIVANIDPHSCIRCLTFAQHGHDGVLGGHKVRSSHSLRHQFTQRFRQIGYISAPHRLRCPRNLEPLPLKAVFQTV